VGEKGFEVCLECGRVRGRDDKIHHSATCRARKSASQEETGNIFLYREIQSEAIRILLPVAEVGLDRKRASFKAALQLGFRRHFQGDPGHLIIRFVPEPIPGGYGTRQYLVVFDGVPGGTGYLSELWQGERFLDVLDEALQALQACVCQRDPERDGCYRCLFAYQSQRDLPIISSREAQEILRSILASRETLKSVHTLSEVTLEWKLESELEVKFLQALQAHFERTEGLSWEEKVQGGEVRWILRTEGQAWEMQSQVDLGPAQGLAIACRPDFLIRPANADPAVRPVAVFCDGLAYHACPGKEQGRIGDDIQKRNGIIHSGKYLVWSIGWRDVEDFEASPKGTTVSALFDELEYRRLGQVGHGIGLTLDRSYGRLGSMGMLLQYLLKPDVAQWEKLGRAHAMTWLVSVPQWLSPEAGGTLKMRLEAQPEFFETGPMAQVGNDAPVLTRYDRAGWCAALARSARSALAKQKVEHFLLRLFDHQEAREDAKFEENWRRFLQAWNLLQFCDGFEATSSEAITVAPYVERAEPLAAEAPSDFGPAGEANLEKILEYATEASRPLIVSVAKANLPFPELDFELPAPSPGCGPEPELAWPDCTVAVLAERQADDAAAFKAAGWAVLMQPVTEEQLLNLLRSRMPANKAAGGNE